MLIKIKSVVEGKDSNPDKAKLVGKQKIFLAALVDI